LTARSFAGKHNQNVRASQELLAMGAANAAAGFTQDFSAGASGSRTAVNDDMGARSQIAGLVAAATVAVIVLFLTEPVQYLPKAVLGAVIVTAAIGLIDPQAWRALAAIDPVEVAIAVSWLVFDAEAVTHADSTGLEAFTALAKDLRHEGITLVVARLRTRMHEQFQHAGITETIGTGNFYPSVHAAVDRFTHTGTGTTGPAA
jgi:MFS superfamily sulfate permease-like transporter